MPLASTIINEAYLLAGGLKAAGQTPTTDESTLGLRALNYIVDSWNADGLLIPSRAYVSYQCTPVQQSYTIGTSQNFNGTRPVRIDSARGRFTNSDGNFEENIDIISQEEWASIKDKTATSNFPQKLYYENTYPNGKIYLWPKPNSTSLYLELGAWNALTAWADLSSTNVALYPGYERALTLALAMNLALRYGGPTQQLQAEYAQAVGLIQNYNASFRPAPPAPPTEGGNAA